MKSERDKEEMERLLGDIFAESYAPDVSHRTTGPLLREFRRAYWHRQAIRLIVAAAALVVLGITSLTYLRPLQSRLQQTVGGSNTTLSETAETLSDSELIDLFPPDSCFLAEIDGKQMLVFRDPALATSIFE